MSQPIIEVRGIGKRYRIRGQRESSGDLRSELASSARRLTSVFRSRSPVSGRSEDFWALRDVSFGVAEGEAVGIIGRNGAGKSTLLKILSRITPPSEGRVVMRGRVASLLEVGTGFHPELSGRENVFLNGSILGMSRAEVRRRFDEIVAFAEVERFLDTPVKRYSSGMYVRLAFAVAAHLEPEVLIVDEVLAVGDAAFQKRCLGKMGDVAQRGRTVLFVSHNLAAMSALCSRAVLLEAGRVVADGPADATVRRYLATVGEVSSTRLADRTDRAGSGPLAFTEAWVEDEQGNRVEAVRSGSMVTLAASYTTRGGAEVRNPYIAFALRDSNGNSLTDLGNESAGYGWEVLPPSGCVRCTLPSLPLNEGDYYFSAYCRVKGVVSDFVLDVRGFHVSAGDFFGTGKLPARRFPVLFPQSWHVES
jgi:lipopolysaccharide transport system ATP-binding protein